MSYVLRKGDKGQEVRRLQQILSITDDGDFGPRTEAAVKLYQTYNSLSADGLAGPNTLGKMNMPVLSGIDVSAWNGVVDWYSVGKSNVSYAWIKHTEGQTHVNPGHKENTAGARNNDVIAGAYHFGRPDTNRVPNMRDAVKEAQWFLKNYDPKPGDLAPVLDIEKGMKTDDSYNVEWCLKWLDVVEAELGVMPVCYTAKWAEDLYLLRANKTLLSELSNYPLWWASYNEGIGPKRKPHKIWSEWKIWQYTSSGVVPGIKGRCDMNWMAGGMLDSLII
jgi:lysozyme